MAKAPRDHIEEIRRVKFSIGGDPNPLTEDLHQAVKNLSAELYAKDVHFLMELIQNAEDNEYEDGVEPSLEFVITWKDITATGASATLLIFNNERGFSQKNIESICSVGRSTKKGNRKRGYIGEKGIGFKSVFLITAKPYIFSNGYQIRFNEEPCPQCNVGYVVPEWVEENPTLSVIKQIYGSEKNLPTTTIVLPLKPDKVKPVKQQLSSIHPEVLLFLSKIKQLSVREDKDGQGCSTVSAVSISTETNFITRKNIDAESYVLHLSANEKGVEFEECRYHMWRQRFPVKQEKIPERRMEVDEWVITLAFPFGDRLNRGTTSPGIYAFLPTEMVTNFPFIIQADFLLASSRETILLDEPWNRGILSCVPSAFVNAFISLVKATEDVPISSLPPVFGFLPVNSSPYSNLNSVRDSIKEKLMDESIIPCESYTDQKFFQKPSEVGRLMPAFWDLLKKGREQGLNLDNISSHGRYILSSAFDKEKYDGILMFMGVKQVDDEWYGKCIRSCNFVLGVSEDVYLDLLSFLAENWSSSFEQTSIINIPLLKYVAADGTVSLCSIYEALQCPAWLLLSYESQHISWLIDWNREFKCAGNRFLLPKSTQQLVRSHSKGQIILDWLVNQVNVSSVNMYDYALLLNKSLSGDRKLVVTYVHFLYHSFRRNFLSKAQTDNLCALMPLVGNYGQITTYRRVIIVPAKGSRWLQLIGSNPWITENYIELADDYLHSGYFAGLGTSEKDLIGFLKTHVGALDIPDLSPPDASIPSAYSLLTKQNAFLLLDWIRNLKNKGIYIPQKFLKSIKEGSWIKISLSGSAGCRPPSQSFLLAPSWVELLRNGLVLVDIPLIDQKYYGDRINHYIEELRTVGVMFDFGEACQYIGNHLMSLAASSTLTRGNVLSMLQFIKFLRERLLPSDNFINSINDRRWMRTSQGDRRPTEAVFFNKEWRAAAQISEIPFIDREYYGQEILSYRTELELLGVLFGFNKSYQVVMDNLKSPACLASPTPEAAQLVLECIRHLESPDKLIKALKDKKCMKTNLGYKSPTECFVFDPEWGSLLQVFGSFPLIDENFYGCRILSYKNELKKLGVLVDFDEATRAFATVFRKQASLLSINKNNVLSLLECYRKLKGTCSFFPANLKNCIHEVKWLRSRLGDYRSPKECILFGPDWKSISSIALLPIIDDSDNHYGKAIYEYKEELQSMGVVVDLSIGAEFVTAGLRLPQDPTSLAPAIAYALLEYTRILLQQQSKLLTTLAEKVNKKWIKSTAGYRTPNECLLYGSEWESVLLKEDGPFIDETFYGSNIRSYKNELSAIGVVVDIHNGCPLLAKYLDVHSDFETIVRIYNFLDRYHWMPASEDVRRIWIPKGKEDGKWVSADRCILHDKNDLFGFQLNVLEKHYEKNLLSFFSNVLEVKVNPNLDDFIKLWRLWEDTDYTLSNADCCAFWGFVLKHWSAKTEKVLCEELLKVPALSGSDRILLYEKHDVFISDDLCLKDLFEQSTTRPLFVWYPRPYLQHLPKAKLLEIYAKIGVRSLSESIQKEKLSAIDDAFHLEQVNPKEIFIGGGLFKLILGFLSDPALQMEVEKRHEALKCLLNITVLQTLQPITVGYSLRLSTGEVLDVKPDRMIRWERQNSTIFVQKLDRESNGRKNVLEYATYFAEVVSEGLLWGKEDHIPQLAELIRLGFIMEFDDAAIEFLMKTNNLELCLEDEEFLSSALPSH